MDAIAISRTGLDVEWRRMEIIALNLANMNSGRAADGTSFQPLTLLSGPAGNFGAVLDGQQPPAGVRTYGVAPSGAGMRRVYEPGHPQADANGYVSYPNVSHAGEMALMVKTARAYEANLVALAAAQQIYSSALQIGKQA
ncbi:MAG TPA: flagellar basal body rod protein FlgC [Sphingomonadaceae bacterium]|nr:flagellar basal body rod protein FlgC [Sphingomonadaceae bacterium]